MERRVVSWFSCGAASAVATKLALAKYGPDRVEIVYTNPGSEHPDNQRFIADCERWFGKSVTQLRSSEYLDTWEVWERRGVLKMYHGGSPCTGHMKRELRLEFQRPDDVQVWGYTAEETERADRFREANFEIELVTPLIDAGLVKSDTIAMVERAGIAIPAMYLLGFNNNNCVGCPKGGMGYWNRVRRVFPDVFTRMSLLERKLGATIFNEGGKPLYLDELDPGRGRHDEPSIDCSLMCHVAELDMVEAG